MIFEATVGSCSGNGPFVRLCRTPGEVPMSWALISSGSHEADTLRAGSGLAGLGVGRWFLDWEQDRAVQVLRAIRCGWVRQPGRDRATQFADHR